MAKPSVNGQTTAGNLELERVLKYIMNEIDSKFTPGNIYVVFNTSDAAYIQYFKDHNKIYADGTEMVHTSLATAYAASTSNRNDIILLNAQNGHAVTTMLDISNNRTHFISMGMRGGSLGMGARSRVTMGNSTTAADIGIMKNTGVGNTFTGIKFDTSSTQALSLYCVVEAGEYAIYRGCEFYKSSDLDDAGASELALNGDSAQFIDCYIGSTANETGNIRANVLCTGGIVSGKKLRDCHFIDCFFAAKADDTDKNFVYGANATDVERSLTFKGCTFFNNPLGAGTPAAAIAFGAAQTRGAVFCDTNCAVVDVTVMGTTGQNIFVMQQDGATYATGGLSAQS